jgi:hypothetical protein
MIRGISYASKWSITDTPYIITPYINPLQTKCRLLYLKTVRTAL